MIKAVIFDMDGVIVDSENLNQRATLKTYRDLGLSYTKAEEEEMKELIGATRRYSWELRKERFHLPNTIEYYISIMEKNRKELVEKEGLKLIPGCGELIYDLYENKFPMAVATSAPRHEIVDNLKRVQLIDYFEHLISGMNCEKGKPDPEIFLKAAKELKVNPENCLVIEDSKNGVIAAKAAGMRCVGYLNPCFSEMGLDLADLVISDMHFLNYQKIVSDEFCDKPLKA